MQPLGEGTLVGGRYRIRRLLGRGGMGAVYEAWQEDLGRVVALKLLHAPDQGSDFNTVTLDRFQREARAAAALGSPHIVQVYDFQAQPGQAPFLVMELLAGQTLARAIKTEGALSPERVARIGVHVLSALDAAHRSSILHRDIKPANVFLTHTPTLGEIAKVLDFGIAKVASEQKLTRAGSMIGTLSYMSPEQAHGAELDPRSDVYSLSLSLYVALTGRNPFGGLEVEEALSRIASGAVPRLVTLRSDVDQNLSEIIATGMTPDRERRFPTAAAMLAALESWLASMTAMRSGYPPPLSAQPAHPSLPPASLSSVQPSLPPAPVTRRSGAKIWLAVLVVLGGLFVVAVALGGVALFFGKDLLESASSPSASASTQSSGASANPSVDSANPSSPSSPVNVGRAKSGSNSSATSPDSGVTLPPVTSSVPTPTGARLGQACTDKCPPHQDCTNGKCVCSYGYTACKDACLDLDRDPDNCGACGKTCSDKQYCGFGSCKTCDPPRAWCAGSCVNLQSDFNNCGTCGKHCSPPLLCLQGECKKSL